MFEVLLFVGAFATFAFFALKRDPIYGLYLYMLMFYVHPPSRWWNMYLPGLRWSLLAAGIALLSLIIHRNKVDPLRRSFASNVPGLVLVLFCALLWISTVWALDREAHLNGTGEVTKYVILFYIFYRVVDSAEKAVDLLTGHTIGCAYLGWLCYVTGRTEDGRLDGVGGPGIDDANSLAMVLATGVVVGFMLLLSQQGRRRIIVALCLPLIANGIVLAGSRGAFLACLLGLLVVFVLCPPGRRWVFFGFAIIGAIGAVRLVDEAFIDRMFTIKSGIEDKEQRDGSSESRVVLMEAQLQMFASHPMGLGHRGTATLSAQYLDERWLTYSKPGEEAARSSHNTFLSVLVEQGIPGTILYFWIVLWGVGTVLSLRRRLKREPQSAAGPPAAACCAALAVILLAGMFTDYLLSETQIWMFAILAGVLETLRPARRRPGRVPVPVPQPSTPLTRQAEQ